MSAELVKREVVDLVSRDRRGRAWGVQCTYERADGSRCKKWSIRGAWVCSKHGGQLPVVRAAANARLRALVPTAVTVLEDVMTSPASSPSEKLRAVKLVLRLNHVSDALPQRVASRAQSAVRAAEQRALPAGTPALDEAIEALLADVRGEEPE